jgi:catechol 2,3-dioxygenase-like lactoylglutathione lyase family enzyme
MLANATPTTILPAKDLDRARRFYADALGLTPVGLQPDGKFLFRLAGGGELALVPKPDGTKAEHTVLSFKVVDITAAIRALEKRGVTFADYDLPGLRTVEHVCVLGSEKAAWFGDGEGNILCLHEDVA